MIPILQLKKLISEKAIDLPKATQQVNGIIKI